MVKLQGEADLHTAPILRDALNDAIESKPRDVDRRPDGCHVHRLDDARRSAQRDPAGPSERHRAENRRRRPTRTADLRADAARPRDEALPQHRDCARERRRWRYEPQAETGEAVEVKPRARAAGWDGATMASPRHSRERARSLGRAPQSGRVDERTLGENDDHRPDGSDCSSWASKTAVVDRSSSPATWMTRAPSIVSVEGQVPLRGGSAGGRPLPDPIATLPARDGHDLPHRSRRSPWGRRRARARWPRLAARSAG